MKAELARDGEGAQGWPRVSLCLASQRKLSENKTLSGLDQTVLPIQQVCA